MEKKLKLKEIVQSIKTRDNLARTGEDIKYVAVDSGVLFVTLAAYLTAAVLLALVVYGVMAAGGIAGILAQLMAVSCINGITCEFDALMGGAGLSLVLITGATIAIIRETAKIERVPFQDNENTEPCRFYSDEMNKALETIQRLGGVENLHSLANFKGIPYTTMRRYVEKFETDGYVKVINNGKGKPVEVNLIR
jgi:hypothetical protein